MHIDPYEKNWMRLTMVLLVVFATAVTIAGFALGFQVPSPEERVNPNTVAIGVYSIQPSITRAFAHPLQSHIFSLHLQL